MNINFLGLLTILFIGLKLTNFIDWSWWIILLPLYAGLALIFIAGTVGILLGISHELFNRVKK